MSDEPELNENELEELARLDELEKLLDQAMEDEQGIENNNVITDTSLLDEAETTQSNTLQVNPKPITVGDLPTVRKVLDQVETRLKPRRQCACTNCPLATWFKTNLVLKCYCKDMFTITYDSSNSNDIVEICDTQIVNSIKE